MTHKKKMKKLTTPRDSNQPTHTQISNSNYSRSSKFGNENRRNVYAAVDAKKEDRIKI